jgi:hypothetical protein
MPLFDQLKPQLHVNSKNVWPLNIDVVKFLRGKLFGPHHPTHSDLDCRIVSKKDFQARFFRTEIINCMIYIVAFGYSKGVFHFLVQNWQESTRKLSNIFNDFSVLSIRLTKKARKSV